MKIAILTLGSRGDVQPYAALGNALQQRGHTVTLCTARNFESLVRSYGIAFRPVEADYQALLDSEEGKRIVKGNPFTIQKNLDKWIYPLIEQSLMEFYHLAQESDGVVYHIKTLADSFADQFPGKMIRAMVVPVVQPTRAFANPAFSGLPLPGLLNQFSYRLSALGMRMMQTPVRRFRAAAGLPPVWRVQETPFLYGISPSFLPQPVDYPANTLYAGFWPGQSAGELLPETKAFLASGPAPIVVTFGSMPVQPPFDLPRFLLRMADEHALRLIVVRGWGLKATEALAAHPLIHVLDSAPFEQLFPQVRAVVHHGGIGTTAACLMAGVPFWVCPVLYPVGDQLFWGKLAHQQRVALPPVPLKKWSEVQATQGLLSLWQEAEMQAASKALAARIQREDGLAAAVDFLETHWQKP